MPAFTVLVDADSRTVRKHRRERLTGDRQLDVQGEAEDGKATMARCQRPRPDGAPRATMLPRMTGFAALVEILKGMPSDYPRPILLVIHIASAFAAGFAEWLDGQSPLRVRYAQDGEPLPRRGEGRVIMAVPDRHMVIRNGRLWLTDDAERHSCRPSVDVLFESVARELGAGAAAG